MVEEAHSLADLVEDRFRTGLAETVTWFQDQMADYYYRTTSRAERVRHIEFVHAMRGMPSSGLTMIDDVEAGKLVVFGPPRSDTFAEALHFIGSRAFNRIEIHTTRDRRMALFAFVYRETSPPPHFDREKVTTGILEATCTEDDCIPRHVAQRYLEAVDDGYLARSTTARVARHIRAWASVEDPEHIYVETDDFRSEGKRVARILLAGRMGRHDYIARLARFLRRHELYLERGYMDEVPSVDGKARLLMSTIYVTENNGDMPNAKRRKSIAAELAGLKRFYGGPLGVVLDRTGYMQHHFEVLAAAVDFAAQILHFEHRFLDVRESGRIALEQYPDVCEGIGELMDFKFGSKPKSERWWVRRVEELREEIRSTENLATATVLEQMLNFVVYIRSTNLYCDHRLGQSFLLDPAILPAETFDRQPYAIIYYHGSQGMGFHVRFRASARGGLRLLLPRNQEQRSRYRNRLLHEVYELAWAQQLKNKDIPEGGSKCIAMIHPDGDADEMVKQLTDSILDLVLPPEVNPSVRGPFHAPREGDLVFLGPDENMTPPRIEWVSNRAAKRGLPHHLTFMSSKAGSGINHKEYGVTSEGVWVWTQQVLSLLEIEDDQSWTLSITGGPDGDVGGNLLRIAHRDHGERCRVVAIADGSGSAADPAGLHWPELLRLVDAGEAIASFDPKHLSKRGGAHVTPVHDPASEKLRNNLHNSTHCDLFIPCGGRPYTIDDRNWQLFLDTDQKPVARAMVEGANIFITPEARKELERHGLIVIKDSSANKAGVITSSYEILAGLVIDEAEFTDIKETYVQDTIAILRAMVTDEAEALIEAWHRRGRHALLSELSQAFSEEINRLATVFEPLVDAMRNDPNYLGFFTFELVAHCPPILVQRFASRLQERIPPAHLTAILTKRLASRMLYREGLTWCRNYVSEERAHDVLDAYITAHEQVRNLMEGLEKHQLIAPEMEQMIADGSRREIVRRSLGR